MLLPLIGSLSLTVFGFTALLFLVHMRRLNVTAQSQTPATATGRYRPMLRLLSDEDLEFVSGDKALARKFRARRRELFRGYIRCLTKDYGRLLAGVRQTMVNSGVDRPDLAHALAKNKILFTLALCRIEIRLQAHALGLAKVDVSGLVEAVDSLRTQVSFLTPAAYSA